jgi:hypothetical protein
MPILNREARDVAQAELNRLGYPKGLYSFSKKNDELSLLAGDRRYCWKLRDLGYNGLDRLLENIRLANAHRLTSRRTTQLDLEDIIRGAAQ